MSDNRINQCSALYCNRLGIYPHRRGYKCQDHYTLDENFDVNLELLFGIQCLCNSNITVRNYTNISRPYKNTVIIEGIGTCIDIDNIIDTYVADKKYTLLRFRSCVRLNTDTISKRTVIDYTGELTIVSNNNRYTTYADLTNVNEVYVTNTLNDNGEEVETQEDSTDYQDSEDIDSILELIRQGKSIFLTGEAGTGKSYNVKLLMKKLCSCVSTASTGTAAFNIRGTTIHSWAALGVTNIWKFMKSIASEEKQNKRDYDQYCRYVLLSEHIDYIRFIIESKSDVDHETYVLILYKYLQFIYSEPTKDELLTAVVCIYSHTIESSELSNSEIMSILKIHAKDLYIQSSHLQRAVDDLSNNTVTQIFLKISDSIDRFIKYNTAYRVNKCRYLILDEVSMISNYFMEILDWKMRILRNNYDQFMGGIICIFVGDLLQLPPVDDEKLEIIITEDESIKVTKRVKKTKQKKDIRNKNQIKPGTYSSSNIIYEYESITYSRQDIPKYNFGDILNKKPGNYRCAHVTEYSEWNNNVSWYVLNKNRRQSNEKFKNILNIIRVGDNLSENYKSELNSRIRRENDPDYVSYNDTVLYGTNEQCIVRNDECFEHLEGKEEQYAADYIIEHITGDIGLGNNGSSILLNYNPPNDFAYIFERNTAIQHNLKLKVGTRVLLLANLNVIEGLVNGALGEIVMLEPNSVKVRFDHNNIEVIIPKRLYKLCSKKTIDIKSARYIKTKIYIRQYPLTLAYGITIHKSQGNTYNNIVISLHYNKDFYSRREKIVDSEGQTKYKYTCTDYGKAYVALSRCRTLRGMRLLISSSSNYRSLPYSKFVADKSIVKRYEQEKKKR